MSVFQKYATAIFSLAVLVIGALQVAVATGITPTAIAQLVVLALGGVITYVVPLVPGKWAGLLKTGIAILAAVIVLVIPYITAGTITLDQILLVVVGAINAAATQLGVNIRKDDTPARHVVVNNFSAVGD